MQFTEPHRIEPPTFGTVDQVEGLCERIGVGPSRQGRELVKDAEFHGCVYPLR